jgi:uncharacterized protein (DUF433 family)
MNRITVDPDVLGGKAVILGTRLAVEFILGLLDAGQSELEILGSYPGLTKEDILACLDYGAKDKSVTELVKWLEERLCQRLLIVDHWDADMSAIGVARPGNPNQLVYISTWGRDPDHYFVELEAAPSPGSDLPYETLARYQELDRENLLKIVQEHLNFQESR